MVYAVRDSFETGLADLLAQTADMPDFIQQFLLERILGWSDMLCPALI